MNDLYHAGVWAIVRVIDVLHSLSTNQGLKLPDIEQPLFALPLFPLDCRYELGYCRAKLHGVLEKLLLSFNWLNVIWQLMDRVTLRFTSSLDLFLKFIELSLERVLRSKLVGPGKDLLQMLWVELLKKDGIWGVVRNFGTRNFNDLFWIQRLVLNFNKPTFLLLMLVLLKFKDKFWRYVLPALVLLGLYVYLSAHALLLWWMLLVSFLALAHVQSVYLSATEFLAAYSSFRTSSLDAFDVLVGLWFQFLNFVLLKQHRGDGPRLNKMGLGCWNWCFVWLLGKNFNWFQSIA